MLLKGASAQREVTVSFIDINFHDVAPVWHFWAGVVPCPPVADMRLTNFCVAHVKYILFLLSAGSKYYYFTQ
ncbi:hypothetical protein [Cupriavidus sp. 8B]